MTINDPGVIAELRELYSQYKNALVTNNVEKLFQMFWHDLYAMRFGVTEIFMDIRKSTRSVVRVLLQIWLEA